MFFVSHVHDRTECMFGRFIGDRKLEGVVDRLNGCTAMQRDLNRPGELGHREPHEDQQMEVQSPVPGEE